MQNAKQSELANKRKAWLAGAKPLIPLLFIWGAEWIFSAAVDFMIIWRDLDWLKLAGLITAVVASLIQIGGMRREKGADPASQDADRIGNPLLLLLPGALLIAAVALLEAIGAVGPLFAPVLRSFLLAVGFVQFGLVLGRPLLYLGLWLFALSAIMGVWYLGYSGIILEGMGGISLLAGGYMLRVWARF